MGVGWGVTRRERVRSDAILQGLKASRLSDLVKERQLRHCGHVERYPGSRWFRFAIRATLPGQKKTGKQKQYCKMISKLLRDNDLTTDMMKDAKKKGGASNKKIQEMFAKTVTNPAVQNTAGAD